MTTREALIATATDLGLDFKGNISNEKLKALVAEAEGPKAAPEPEAEPEAEPTALVNKVSKEKRPLTLREKIQQSKARASKLVVVTITNKDNRENDVMTTVHLSVENQHFAIGRNVPLDIPVEIEQCLVDLAECTMMTLHKDEIVNGRRTGNKVPVTVKKFAISYGKQAG